MEKKFNIKEYIDSGILEQYVLGMTNSNENVEILSNIKKYPELKIELLEIEQALENYAAQFVKPMSGELKDKILKKILDEKMSPNPSPKSKTWPSQLLMYSFLVLLALITIYLWKSKQEKAGIVIDQQIALTHYKKVREQDSLALMDCKNQVHFFRNNNSKRVLLKGTPNSPQSLVMMYYDTVAQKTTLAVLDLPPVPHEKQYQLWAIVKGKPVDLGVFDLDDKIMLKEIKFVSDAQAFAITLEPKGGVESPTMDQMFVIGGL